MSYLHHDVIEGQRLLPIEPNTVIGKGKAKVGIKGNQGTGITLYPELFARHILTLGAIGSGKSNTMYHVVNAIRKTITDEDVLVFFDAKGDYLEKFYEQGDYVLSNSLEAMPGNVHWNIYRDILHTPREKREETIREITTALFKEEIEKSQSPIFSMGARDILAALLDIHVKEIEAGKAEWDHQKLLEFVRSTDDVRLRNIFIDYPEHRWVRNYIQKDSGATAQSFMVHFYQTIYKIFGGSFGKPGNFSIREAVTTKGGKAVFLEYDLASGNVLESVYTVLLDLAMKEVLGRSKSSGNVYFILDEFPLIPKLNYMDNALNFGRSLGVKVIAGIQNIGQVEYKYGKSLAVSILSGFGTVFAFRLFDYESRAFVSGRHGKSKKWLSMLSSNSTKGVNDSLVEGQVIEDWDIVKLDVGECVLSLPKGEPYIFYPIEY